MSRANFDPRDREDPLTFSASGAPTRVRLMARSGGYVMVRNPHCAPYVLNEKQWAKLPLYASPAPAALEQG